MKRVRHYQSLLNIFPETLAGIDSSLCFTLDVMRWYIKTDQWFNVSPLPNYLVTLGGVNLL